MRSAAVIVLAILAFAVASAAAESSLDKLKAKVEAGTAAAPCDKLPPPGPAPPRQYLDQRLPIVVNDYHPPVGGFNPTDIPSKEVDVAARKILREIQKAEKEAAANGLGPAAAPAASEISVEEHKLMKQLLLDADILVRAAGKMLAENGPIEEKKVKKIVKKVAKSAVKKAKKNLKKAAKKAKRAAKKAARKAAKLAKKAAKQLAKSPAAPSTPTAPAAKAPAPAPATK